MVATDFDGNATITTDRIAFFAEKKFVERMEAIGGGWSVRRGGNWVGR
jgi:hypothetical protein